MHGSHRLTCSRRGVAAALAASSLLAVFTTATPASANTAVATVGGSKVVCTSEKAGLASRLSHDIAGALGGRQDTSALALYDRITGTTCELRADAHFDSASVVKVTVLGALLRQAEEAHRKLTPQEVKLTTAMITKSDNDATSALWHQIGSMRLQEVPGPGRHEAHRPRFRWQLGAHPDHRRRRAPADAAADDGELGAHRDLARLRPRSDGARRLRPEVGVPAGSPASATVHVKNGWLPRATDGWRVHSVGAFTGSGHDYGMTVLSSGNLTMDYGVATIEGAARVIHRDLTSAR